MLNRDDKVFFAVVEHEKIEAPSIYELRTKVKEALSKGAKVTWSRIIELSVSQRTRGGWGTSDHIESHDTELSVSFKRFEVGVTARGIHLKRPFPEDEDEHWREDVAENPLMHSSTDYEHESKERMPYSDAVWAALNGVKEAIEAAYAKLEPLFDTKDRGQKLLALTGIKLLPASITVVDARIERDAAITEEQLGNAIKRARKTGGGR